MNIVLNERKNGRIQDSIEYVLNTDKKNFNKILKTLKAPKGSLDFSYKFEIENPGGTQTDFFTICGFSEGISNIDVNELDRETLDRIKKLQKCRTLELAKKQIGKECGANKDEIQDIFSVLEGQESFSELIEKNSSNQKNKNIFAFLNFRKSKMLPEGKDAIRNRYYEILNKIAYGGYLYNYFIPNYQELEKNFNLTRNRIMAEEDTLKHKIILKQNDEPDWKINDELKEYVYKDMPENLSSEEISVWIYMKLCQTFSYRDANIFEETNNKIDINLLESLKPNSKIVCFDFARVYAKFVNTLPGNDIEAQVVGTGNHFFVELISSNIIAKAEATNQQDHTNEFFKVKMGLPIEGLRATFDEQDVIKGAIKKFTPIIYKDEQTIANYIKMLDAVHKDEEKEEIEPKEDKMLNKLNSLIKTMKEHQIEGTEAMMGIMKFTSLGIFGEDIEKSWLKEKAEGKKGETIYNSSMAICYKDEFYVFNSKTMQVEKLPKEELIRRFKDNKYAYKYSKYGIKAVNQALPELTKQEEVSK